MSSSFIVSWQERRPCMPYSYTWQLAFKRKQSPCTHQHNIHLWEWTVHNKTKRTIWLHVKTTELKHVLRSNYDLWPSSITHCSATLSTWSISTGQNMYAELYLATSVNLERKCQGLRVQRWRGFRWVCFLHLTVWWEKNESLRHEQREIWKWLYQLSVLMEYEGDKARGSFHIFVTTDGEYLCGKRFKIMWKMCSFSLNFNTS